MNENFDSATRSRPGEHLLWPPWLVGEACRASSAAAVAVRPAARPAALSAAPLLSPAASPALSLQRAPSKVSTHLQAHQVPPHGRPPASRLLIRLHLSAQTQSQSKRDTTRSIASQPTADSTPPQCSDTTAIGKGHNTVDCTWRVPLWSLALQVLGLLGCWAPPGPKPRRLLRLRRRMALDQLVAVARRR